MKELKPIDVANKLKDISKVNVFEETRKRDVVEIRMLLCYLLREKLNMRWINIAKFFSSNGKKMTHATAIHSCNMYPKYKKHNKQLKKFEKMFSFKSNLTYDEIDKIHYLENQIKNLQEKLNSPLIKLVNRIPLNEHKDLVSMYHKIKK